MKLARFALIASLCLTTSAHLRAQGVYKWTDAEGHVHYGDHPESAKASQVTIQHGNSQPASNNVEVLEPEWHYYEIQGSSVPELLAATRAYGPLDTVLGTRWGGHTHWNVNWDLDYSSEGGQCRIAKAKVIVKSVIDMPNWANKGSGSFELQKKWDQYYSALRTHELGHRDTAVRYANDMAAKIAQMKPQSDCVAMKQAVQAIGASTVKTYNQLDLAYDRSTIHGETQGAILR